MAIRRARDNGSPARAPEALEKPKFLDREARHANGPRWFAQAVDQFRRMVELRGIEPLTFSLRTRRSPN